MKKHTFCYLVIIISEVLGRWGLAQNPDQAKSWYDKGRSAYLRYMSDDYKTALSYYERSIAADSNYAPAFAGKAEALTLLALEKEQNGLAAEADFTHALRSAQQAIAKKPDQNLGYRALAQAYLNMDPKTYGEKAHDALQRAIELDSTDAESYFLLWLLTENDKPNSPFLRLSLKLDPNSFQTHYALGQYWSRNKQPDKAIDEYKLCIRINPDNYRSYYSLGNVYSQIKRYDMAAEEYEKAIAINKNLYEAYFYVGVAYYYLDKNKKAQQRLSQYIEMQPNPKYKPQAEQLLMDMK